MVWNITKLITTSISPLEINDHFTAQVSYCVALLKELTSAEQGWELGVIPFCSFWEAIPLADVGYFVRFMILVRTSNFSEHLNSAKS